jgi:hypothetical protein
MWLTISIYHRNQLSLSIVSIGRDNQRGQLSRLFVAIHYLNHSLQSIIWSIVTIDCLDRLSWLVSLSCDCGFYQSSWLFVQWSSQFNLYDIVYWQSVAWISLSTLLQMIFLSSWEQLVIFFRKHVIDRSIGQRTKMMEGPYYRAIIVVTYSPSKNVVIVKPSHWKKRS